MDTMRQRILVVDDDPSLAEMLTIVLRGEGFDTAVVGDGTQALTAVRELRPDLVLLDLMLPGMNGIDVCCIGGVLRPGLLMRSWRQVGG